MKNVEIIALRGNIHAFIHGIKRMPVEFTPADVPRLDPLPGHG